jgi:glycosyltransferase involved in cell wall biosynthesis
MSDVSTFPHTVPNIFFSSTLHTPFIEQDATLLSRHYPLEKLFTKGMNALARIPGGVARSRVTFSWFGSVYAGYTVMLARKMGKKSIIVVGGVDAAREPEIRYGIWLNPLKAPVVRYAFIHADRVLAVDASLQAEVVRLAHYDGRNITCIPFGYDSTVWVPGKSKADMVLTVAACHDKWRMKKKGIDKIFEAARALPNVPFSVIGIHPRLVSDFRMSTPENVQVIPYVPQMELLPYYQKAKVYCQPSYTEGLPNTLCEAMLCGCIPVGTAAGGIPTAIGTAGYLVGYRDQAGLVGALRNALASPATDGLKARDRIAREFTLERREQSLCEVIDELCNSSLR